MSHEHNYIGVGPEGLQGAALEAAGEAFSAGYVKVHVTLPTGSTPAGEYMWAKPVLAGSRREVRSPSLDRRQFCIDNIPFYDVGFTVDAIVEADRVNDHMWEFRRVLDPGPWRQLWFGTTDPRGGPTFRAIKELHPEGDLWKYEAMHTCSFVAVARGEGPMAELKATLSRLCAEEIIGFYWDADGDGEMSEATALEVRGR